MKRFTAILKADAKLMVRNGFLAAAVIVIVTWSTALHFLPESASDTWLPVALWLDMAVVGFFFMTAAVLYEKNQRTMTALIITPLAFREYIGSKLLLLSGPSLIGCTVITLISRQGGVNYGMLLLGVSTTAVVTLLYSFATVMPFSSMSAYTIPANIYLGILQLGLLPHFGWVDWLPLKLLPTYGTLQLIQAAFVQQSAATLVFGMVSAVVWTAILFSISMRLHRRYVLVRGVS